MSQHSLPRSTPEEQGMTSNSILSFIDAVESEKLELHSLMIVKNDHVIAEGWWEPYQANDQHHLNSLSKSFTSTAIGLAVDENRISIDDQVISFFSEYVTEEIKDNMKELKVKHLLSMSTGHINDTLPILWANKTDWVKAFLETPIDREPGTYFLYNTGASYMLSAIVQKVTGQKLLDYLRPRLFEQLGIKDVTSPTCTQGIHVGGYGMRLTTEDIAKFGQLYLHGGMWNGQRILSENWVRAATSKQVSNGNPENQNDWSQGYGFQFWRCQHDAYRGDGAFGQFCVVLPNQYAVIAITAGLMEMQDVLDLVWKHLLPGLNENDVSHDSISKNRLKQRLNNLTYLPVVNSAHFPSARSEDKITYSLEANDTGYTEISYSEADQEVIITFTNGNKEGALRSGLGYFLRGATELAGFQFEYAACGVWRRKNILEISLFMTEYPIHDRITFHFVDDSVQISSTRNVWVIPVLSDMASLPTLIGTRVKE